MSDQVLESMFGIFDQTAEDIVVTEDTSSSSADVFKVDPKMSDDKYYRAIIRFLPNIHDVSTPIVKRVTYWIPDAVAGGKRGIKHVSKKSLGKYEDCLVANKYWEWMNTKDARLVSIAKKLQYNRESWSLIQIIKDVTNPKNNGKIMLFKVPVKIQKMIESAVRPSKEDIEMGAVATNIFDPIAGLALTLKVGMKKTAEGEFRDWDECTWTDKKFPILDVETLKPFEDDEDRNKKIVKLLTEAPSLADYAYKEPSAAHLEKVKNALNALAGLPINETKDDAPAETEQESKDEVKEQPAKATDESEAKAAESTDKPEETATVEASEASTEAADNADDLLDALMNS